MSYTVRLQDENGKLISQLDEQIPVSLFKRDDFTLLKYLDPYGNTTFNQVQINDLISDCEKIDAKSISELAMRCKNEAHTYLVFLGD